MNRALILAGWLLMAAASGLSPREGWAAASGQTPVPQAAETAAHKPRVVIYTLTTCPHCQEAKEYMASHSIPFVNREVDIDDQHMQELMEIYDAMKVPLEKRGVPLIIIDGKVRLQGFNRDRFSRELERLDGRGGGAGEAGR